MIVETKLVLESLVVVIASVLGVPIVILVRQQEYNHALDVPMECLICPHGMPYLSQWNALSVPMECLICPNGLFITIGGKCSRKQHCFQHCYIRICCWNLLECFFLTIYLCVIVKMCFGEFSI